MKVRTIAAETGQYAVPDRSAIAVAGQFIELVQFIQRLEILVGRLA